MIDITNYDKAEVLAVLYNNSKVQGLVFLHAQDNKMSKEEAQTLLNEATTFDYLYGKVMKIDLSSNELNPWLYDRDNGEGAAEKAIKTLSH